MEASGQLYIPAPGKERLVPNFIGGWVGPRAGLDAVEKRKIYYPYREWDLGHAARL
jgi:hypothetical protein